MLTLENIWISFFGISLDGTSTNVAAHQLMMTDLLSSYNNLFFSSTDQSLAYSSVNIWFSAIPHLTYLLNLFWDCCSESLPSTAPSHLSSAGERSIPGSMFFPIGFMRQEFTWGKLMPEKSAYTPARRLSGTAEWKSGCPVLCCGCLVFQRLESSVFHTVCVTRKSARRHCSRDGVVYLTPFTPLKVKVSLFCRLFPPDCLWTI